MNEVPSVLAIDPGTQLGWARLLDGRTESGVEDLRPRRGESPGMRYVRPARALRLPALDATGRPLVRLIVYEQPHLRGGHASEVLAGITTRIQEFCAEFGIEHAAAHTGELKRFATGRGKASKKDMMWAARRYGFRFQSEHEAEALLLLKWACEELLIKTEVRR